MTEIINGIQKLAREELIRANNKKPLFASDHEAFGVLAEEVHETLAEAVQMDSWLDGFKSDVFNDNEDGKDKTVKRLRVSAVLCAAEAVQVIAMCDKRMMSKEKDNE